MLSDMTLPNGTSLNIIEEIGTKYEHFGILLLDDEFGKRMEIIKHDKQDVARIITQILREWLEGTGLKPTWGTLLKVLKKMKEHELAEAVACSVNHMYMLQTHQHDEH